MPQGSAYAEPTATKQVDDSPGVGFFVKVLPPAFLGYPKAIKMPCPYFNLPIVVNYFYTQMKNR